MQGFTVEPLRNDSGLIFSKMIRIPPPPKIRVTGQKSEIQAENRRYRPKIVPQIRTESPGKVPKWAASKGDIDQITCLDQCGPSWAGATSDSTRLWKLVRVFDMLAIHKLFLPDIYFVRITPFYSSIAVTSGLFRMYDSEYASDPHPPHTRQKYEQESGQNMTPNASKQGKFGSLGAMFLFIFLPCMWELGFQKESPMTKIRG